VYKLSKALYELKQARRARYVRLKTFLLDHGYVMESVEKTLFTLKYGNDFLVVHIYANDIIFGGSSYVFVLSFQEMMENEFQISMMGVLTYFLGIQVKQTMYGTFVHLAKYTKDLMKKFGMVEVKPMSNPMSMVTVLDPDENGEAVDQREYNSMIGSLSLSCTSWQHSRTFSSSCACVHDFKFPHALHIGKSFSGFSGISNTHLNLGFGTLLHLHLILLGFSMLILPGVELI
jgi:hypothetical protein